MANLQAATSTDPGRVTDPKAIEELCNQYVFERLNWELNEDGEFGLWGYGNLTIYKADEDDPEKIDYDGGPRTLEFLRELSHYLAEGEAVDIQTTGFTKCRRYEMVASRYVVRHEQLLHADLGDAEPLPAEEQPPSEGENIY